MRKIFIIMLAVVAASIFAGGPTKAQVAADTEVRANVPFQFYAGDTRFPAGQYRIALLDPMEPNVLMVSTANGQVTAIVMVHQTNNPNTAPKATGTELSFNKYGTRYFLSSIQVLGDNNATQMEESQFEKLVSKGEVRGEGRRVTGQSYKVKGS